MTRLAPPPGSRRFRGALLLVLVSLSIGSAPVCAASQARAAEVLRLWPGQAPGTEGWTGPEEEVDAELPNLGKVHIITNVTVPTLTVFRPAAGKANGTAMLVVPGGAFRALTWDLDGIETAKWLVSRGIAAFVLKYRVRPPATSGAPGPESFAHFATRTRAAREIAIADARQALALIRSSAKQYGIAPRKVGMIGFSAGAMTVMGLAVARDSAQRPDFAVSLYGALLYPGAPPAGSPPLFIVAAQNDGQAPPARSVEMFQRWTTAGLPAELHLYEKGGHGFAFRPHDVPADRWPAAFEAWLASRGYIAGRDKDEVRGR
ncbi:MAG: dienelactone hydrolase family protein [Sphingomonas sp.]|nr:dienelactone hydrolase family protein [Sphingomonas sp.]